MSKQQQALRLNFGDSDTEQLRALVQRMGEFVALFEVAETKLRERESSLEQHMQDHEATMAKSMEQINYRISELEGVMTEAGVARWRLAAEDSLKEGKAHLQEIKQTLDSFQKGSKEVCGRLDRATAYTVKGISEAINAFRPSDFRQLTENACVEVEHTAASAIKSIARVTRWFYWKKLMMVFSFALVVAVVTGLYLTAEWPWEIHDNVIKERLAGKAVLQSWPQLIPQDKQLIEKNSREGLV